MLKIWKGTTNIAMKTENDIHFEATYFFTKVTPILKRREYISTKKIILLA
jgi:hypothetical protein